MGVFDNDNTQVQHKPLVPIKELKKVPQGYMQTANGILIKMPAQQSIGLAPVKTRFAKDIDKRRGEVQQWKEEEQKKKQEQAEAIEGVIKMTLPSTYIGPLFNNNGKSYTDNLLSGEGTGDWESNLAIDLVTPFAIKLTPSMIKPRFFKAPKVLNQESTHNVIEGTRIINGNANIDKLTKAGLFNPSPSKSAFYVKQVASPNLYKVIGSTDKYYDDVIYDIFDRVEKQAPKDFLTDLQINQAVKDVVNNKTYYINDLESSLNGWFLPANNFGKGKAVINVSAPIGDEELLGALIHERYMHPTERIVERLKLHKPYEDFLEEIGLNKDLWNEFRAELGHLKYVNQPEVNASLEELLKHFYPSSSGANVFKDAINNTIKNNPELKSDITNKLKSLITTGPAIAPIVSKKD